MSDREKKLADMAAQAHSVACKLEDYVKDIFMSRSPEERERTSAFVGMLVSALWEIQVLTNDLRFKLLSEGR